MVSIERGLNLADEFSASVAKSMEFNLCKADLIRLIVTMPNISEGGVSISFSDRNAMIGIANNIYSKYNEPLIAALNPTVELLDW